MRNAKKLAQKGALQIESNRAKKKTNLNEIDKLSTPSVLGGGGGGHYGFTYSTGTSGRENFH